ncbi:MAG: hypothetical protein RLZZ175_748 [Bacteroidota bacterium]|jgi:hypothetical protein
MSCPEIGLHKVSIKWKEEQRLYTVKHSNI